ncbi:MAG: hypothetical protein QOF91_3035 [Alphaproteobacteria bacterium]|nr:hypothetical protein [Alphaproteobacteria bacterium]
MNRVPVPSVKQSMSAAPLPIIPVIDLREGGPPRGAVEGRERARALRDDCLSWLPGSARSALPLLDGVTRRWLSRSASDYVGEIEAVAATLGFPGIWFLNGCYQWGCTSLAREEGGAPWLARTLDWPFPGLGRHLQVAHMQGQAGSFDNVCWPGYVGVLTASAPGRFAAAINQAPMKRRTHAPALRLFDILANALGTWRIRFVPPDHLLREVFETCANYGEARRRLEITPIARPVIFTLAGCRPGERCVIERTEVSFSTREEHTGSANDWLVSRPHWEARMRTDQLLSKSSEEAAASSHNRREKLAAWSGRFAADDFGWVVPPVLNPMTRLAVEMCPADGILRVRGYERDAGAELPMPATQVRVLEAAAV